MYEKAGKGTFVTDANIPIAYEYQVETWIKNREHPRRRSGKRLDESQLLEVDLMTLKITQRDDKDNVTHITMYGPFLDWDEIERILAYDYGDEGSLFQFGTATGGTT